VAESDHPRSAVVGYDGSPLAGAAVELAARRVGAGGTLHIICVASPPPEWQGDPYYGHAVQRHREHATAMLERLAGLDVGGAHVETDVIEGSPARVLAEAARARGADEIVIGSRGFGPFRGALGSVSHALLHEADRPVLILPGAALETGE
jgi:nucleotide-binding universal stress UspA family protein